MIAPAVHVLLTRHLPVRGQQVVERLLEEMPCAKATAKTRDRSRLRKQRYGSARSIASSKHIPTRFTLIGIALSLRSWLLYVSRASPALSVAVLAPVGASPAVSSAALATVARPATYLSSSSSSLVSFGQATSSPSAVLASARASAALPSTVLAASKAVPGAS